MDIICSIGPKVNNPQALTELYDSGMTVLRFNCSHIEYDHTKSLIDYVRKHMKDASVLMDLQGPKLRVGKRFTDELRVYPGQEVLFCSEEVYEHYRMQASRYILIPVSFDGDFSALMSAKSILMKDATMKFRIIGRNDNFIKTVVERGGIVRAEKGVNAPGMKRVGLGLTEKDKKDVLWALDNNADILVLSFVSCADNMTELRKFIEQYKKYKNFNMPKLYAKIECMEGVKNFDSILEVADGIMLGRGDLFAEAPICDIPRIQDVLLKKAKRSGKPFVIATYVLSSMRSSAMPLIPEINDIYNSIKSGATGFMLSGEVSTGVKPTNAVDMLQYIINRYQ